MERLKTAAIVALLLALAGSIALAASGGTAEVRITARQLDNGRVEFALQQRTDGEWGERILPRSRYFPANPKHNRWLNSSPMTVSVAAVEEPPAAAEADATCPAPTTTCPAPPIRTTVGSGFTSAGAWWQVGYRADGTRFAVASPPSKSRDAEVTPSLLFSCGNNGERLIAWFTDLPNPDIIGRYSVSYRWGNESAATLHLLAVIGEFSLQIPSSDAPLWRNKANSHSTLLVRINGYSRTAAASYDLAALRALPSWANILACGN